MLRIAGRLAAWAGQLPAIQRGRRGAQPSPPSAKSASGPLKSPRGRGAFRNAVWRCWAAVAASAPTMPIWTSAPGTGRSSSPHVFAVLVCMVLAALNPASGVRPGIPLFNARRTGAVTKSTTKSYRFYAPCVQVADVKPSFLRGKVPLT